MACKVFMDLQEIDQMSVNMRQYHHFHASATSNFAWLTTRASAEWPLCVCVFLSRLDCYTGLTASGPPSKSLLLAAAFNIPII